MTRRQIEAGLKRMRRLYAAGKLKEAADLAATLAPHCHEVLPPVVEVTVKR